MKCGCDRMKILVTGGAGFIGSNLVDRLVKDHKVIVVDNLFTGKKENINKAAKFYHADVTSPHLRNIFRTEKPEIVFHLAAQMNVRKSAEDPIFDAKTNILGTLNLLTRCAEFGAKKIIYSSSGGAIYGEPHYLSVKENHPVTPLSQYGLSKFVGEKYIELYRRNYGLNCSILRYSNVYGPRQDPSGEAGVISIFIGRLLKGQRPVIFGDGEQTRDFVYVDDVVKANLVSLKKEGTYNIGTGKETSVNEIFEMLSNLLGRHVKPFHDKPVEGEVRRICLDVSKARRELNWKASTSIKEGLKETIKWAKEEAK
jgi:UDP-glucose 4-epimerase